MCQRALPHSRKDLRVVRVFYNQRAYLGTPLRFRFGSLPKRVIARFHFGDVHFLLSHQTSNQFCFEVLRITSTVSVAKIN